MDHRCRPWHHRRRRRQLLLLLLIRKHDLRLEFVEDGHFVVECFLEVADFLRHERNLGAEANVVLSLDLLLLPNLGNLPREGEKDGRREV